MQLQHPKWTFVDIAHAECPKKSPHTNKIQRLTPMVTVIVLEFIPNYVSHHADSRVPIVLAIIHPYGPCFPLPGGAGKQINVTHYMHPCCSCTAPSEPFPWNTLFYLSSICLCADSIKCPTRGGVDMSSHYCATQSSLAWGDNDLMWCTKKYHI